MDGALKTKEARPSHRALAGPCEKVGLGGEGCDSGINQSDTDTYPGLVAIKWGLYVTPKRGARITIPAMVRARRKTDSQLLIQSGRPRDLRQRNFRARAEGHKQPVDDLRPTNSILVGLAAIGLVIFVTAIAHTPIGAKLPLAAYLIFKLVLLFSVGPFLLARASHRAELIRLYGSIRKQQSPTISRMTHRIEKTARQSIRL